MKVYQVIIHASSTCKHVVFCGEDREEAERKAALWCLGEVVQEWDLLEVRSAPGTRDLARNLGRLAREGNFKGVLEEFLESEPDQYQLVSSGLDCLEVVDSEEVLVKVLHKGCQRTPEELTRVLAHLSPLPTLST